MRMDDGSESDDSSRAPDRPRRPRVRRNKVRVSKARRWIKLLAATGLIGLGLLLLSRWLLTPGPMERTEISPGIFLEVFHLDNPLHGSGAVMVTEAHWDTPGVEIVVRPFDPALLASERHFRLALPSWLVLKNRYQVLMNTTRFGPGERHYNYPGAPVATVESAVADGKWSHIHEHSYMLWWDKHGNATFDTRKPPSDEARRDAKFGMGVQAVQVGSGQVAYGALGGHMDGGPFSQSFIGVDPDRRILWLVAFEHATEKYAAELLAAQGAKFAGRLDSGNGTNMVAGPAARKVFPFIGIRNWRFVGNYIAIRSRPE